ncbi:hypothetical protein QBC36DRAFT_346270 [Triangularia setosa]|uniref:Uncharacterized protein n=1 Tax=Triangularia setosa TaxID=2587417 RepID=A0AAN7A7V8_9PEZI|nr:hypothetical protein QBC36DRAFT_346270 [Podospora setosa]
MSSPVNINNEFSDISSLYGPGNVGSWYCILASVVITWMFNLDQHGKDTLTNDLIATLAFPVEPYGCSDGSLQFRIRLICPHDFDDASMNRYYRAVEAPLAVCNQFVQLAIILLFVAAGSPRPWNASCVFLVWLLTLWIESIMIWMGGSGYCSSTL